MYYHGIYAQIAINIGTGLKLCSYYELIIGKFQFKKCKIYIIKVITKILSFTSNAYRGRLFVSYLLSMPSLLKFGWDALVSNFVS